MKFGLSESEFDYITKTVVEPLVAHGAVVWCFGSRARGTHQKFSDLDLMIEGPPDIQPLLGEIAETLIESRFPYKVDLVELRNFSKFYLRQFYQERQSWITKEDSENKI
ncbi:MAG: nucleotidyltransferase domain-containing protein [Proteobacteria bacterium]|nr:nucleotidyltransferase domain-containing protein [Pseudomonadota bacterium]